MEEEYQQKQELIRRSTPNFRQPEKQKVMRIKAWMAWILIIVAILLDLIEMATTWIGAVVIGGVLTTVLSIVAGAGFWIWFQILGISMSSNTKRFAVSLISFLAEIIPGFDAIPILSWAWTIGMILTVIITRMEDRGESVSILGALNETMSFMTPWGAVATKLDYKIFDRRIPGSKLMEKTSPLSYLGGKMLYPSNKKDAGNSNIINLKNSGIINAKNPV